MSGNAPLFLKKILVTRGAAQSSSFSKLIEARGGTAIESSLLSFKLIDEKEQLKALHNLHSFQWLIFTSQNGISFFLELLEKCHINREILNKLNIAVVGKKTELELKKYGLEAKVVPKEYVAENLLDSLLPCLHPGDKTLIVRGNLARTVIKEGLMDQGYEAEELTVYKTVPNHHAKQSLRELLIGGELDAITFTSSSTVVFFMEMIEDLPRQSLLKDCLIVCIGPITAETVKSFGITEYLVPSEYTINGMINVLVHHFSDSQEAKEENE
ncbi:uroporphyrinogen-III synthase [Priestia abyssalis]|uniref:uroporphyrinogen-III synthase n=1 Tax=Priestia abyssalis TaxID=1221450 RepID=UPI00099507A6|nr:uroporphyrinogen-III synthase [Priestia abyssalis]